jgi:23S rRNA pseudouridine1911/1915/1917 synthase
MTSIHHNFVIPQELAGLRLDQAISKVLPVYSRTQIQEWIKNSALLVDGKPAKARDGVLGGETILIDAQPKQQPTFLAQQIDLNIIFEDDDLLIINKPVGMVVHPGTGNMEGTLLNALLHHAPSLNELPRAGIIHRLDKDTSGLLVIAKTAIALTDLSRQLKDHAIKRIYQTVVNGIFLSGGTINQPISRHAINRKKMAVMETGKEAVTHYRLMERYRAHTRLKVQLETGRTHQIRVHMSHIHHAVLGDQIYGGRLQLPKGATPPLIDMLRKFKRQALHAAELEFTHPTSGEIVTFQAPLPDDMVKLIDVLKQDAAENPNKNFL